MAEIISINRSFDQLERLKRLDLIRIDNLEPQIHFKSSSVETLFLEELGGIEQFLVDAAELLNIRIWFAQLLKVFTLRLARKNRTA